MCAKINKIGFKKRKDLVPLFSPVFPLGMTRGRGVDLCRAESVELLDITLSAHSQFNKHVA